MAETILNKPLPMQGLSTSKYSHSKFETVLGEKVVPPPNRIAYVVDPQPSAPIAVKVWQSSVAALAEVNGTKENFKDEESYREFVEQVKADLANPNYHLRGIGFCISQVFC